jgi:hypothetical protein
LVGKINLGVLGVSGDNNIKSPLQENGSVEWRLPSNNSVKGLVWGFREQGGSPFHSVKAIVNVL